MKRDYYTSLARSGLRMPIGTHLLLHQQEDVGAVLLDGVRLGKVIEETARCFRTPLGMPLMDLALEKEELLTALHIPAEKIDSFHFDTAPSSQPDFSLTPRMQATCEAIRYVAAQQDLLPIGMAIGPFSFMTKLVADPIMPVFTAGTGVTADEDPEVELVEKTLKLVQGVILSYLREQIAAGAKAIVVCEPAANKVYFSPNQLAESYEIFDRYVMAPNREIKDLLESNGVDLIFHDCGELTDDMVQRFGTLDPAILSLGSSRVLWEDARLISKNTVLYGNLPSKHFYSDATITTRKVSSIAMELVKKMNEIDHPFILGSECDVLSVPKCEATIREKVDAFMSCDCGSIHSLKVA